MKKPTRDLLGHFVDMALAYQIAMSDTFRLVEVNGLYSTPSDVTSCHPLETVLVGNKVKGHMNVAIAEILSVSANWVDGFADGYGGCPKDARHSLLKHTDEAYRSYQEGYQDGVEYVDSVKELSSHYTDSFSAGIHNSLED